MCPLLILFLNVNHRPELTRHNKLLLHSAKLFSRLRLEASSMTLVVDDKAEHRASKTN